MLATWAQSLLAFLFITVCILLILLVLIQKGRGGGLSGAFGGVGSYSPFGTKTGDALTWATVILTGLFLLLAVLANYAFRPINLGNLGATVTAPAGQAQPSGESVAPQTPEATPAAPAQSGTPEAAPSAATPAPSAAPAAAAPSAKPASPASQPSGN